VTLARRRIARYRGVLADGVGGREVDRRLVIGRGRAGLVVRWLVDRDRSTSGAAPEPTNLQQACGVLAEHSR
jgi:hypothetical protein